MNATRRAPESRTPPSVYQLHVELEYIRPAIWRRLWVPGKLSLAKLDQVIQVAMGWMNSHLHAFDIGDVRYTRPSPDWPDEDERDDRRFDLAGALADGTTEFVYTYDFGDDWRHYVRVEAILAPDERNSRATCVAGANACPPEDVGGPPGYEQFLQVMADPNDPEHQHTWDWYGGPFDPAAFDLNAVNARLRQLRL